MNILLITNGYPPHRWAGTETYTAGIAEEFHRRGNQIQVLCAGEWEKGPRYWNGYDDETHQGIAVRRVNLNWINAPDPFGYLFNNPVIGDFLKGFLNEFQPDIVHVTSCETLSASVLQVVKNVGLPLVLSLTDFWFLCPRINLLRSNGENCGGNTTPWECLQCQMLNTKPYQLSQQILGEQGASHVLTQVSKFPLLTRQRGLRGFAGDMAARKSYLRQALEWPNYLITASQFVRDIHISNGVASSIKVNPYGHDLSWLDNYEGKTSSDVVRFGFIGQIIHSKGVHLLLEAAHLLQSALGDKFKLSIFGNVDKYPEYGTQLKDLAKKINNFQFRGTYAHEDTADVFAEIDVLVVPSLWYDFPLIIHEAFAIETPVIATNLGGMAEAITHELNGLLFRRGDVGDLARQLRRFVDEPGLLEQLRKGIPTVKTITEEVNELEAIYKEVINN